MERVIKFRGKRIDNGEWVYGDLFNSHADHHSPNLTIATDEFYPLGFGSKRHYQVDPKSVGQYIRLSDKDGKEIYERDIFTAMYQPEAPANYHGNWPREYKVNCVVEYHNCSFLAKNLNKGKASKAWVRKQIRAFSDIEVVGNVFDNPELLNK